MLSIKLFKEKSFLEKLTITVRNIPEDRMFYIGLLSLLLILFSTYFIINQINRSSILTPLKGTSITIISEENIRFLNPLYAKNNLEKFTSSLLYSSLVRKNDDTYTNDLADTIELEAEGLIVNVKLKDDIYFSDGTPITSEDVIFTYEMAGNITIDYESRVKYEGIKSEILDKLNFKLLLKKSYSNVNDILTIGILKKSDYSDVNLDSISQSEKSFNTTESGLYTLKNVTRDTANSISSMELKRNRYNSTQTNHNTIYLESLSDEKLIMEKLTNSNDNNMILFDVNNKNYEKLLDNKYIKNDYTLPRISAIYLNANKNEIFTNKDNRRKIYQAIDRTSIVNDILAKYATTTYDLLPVTKNQSYELPIYNTISTTTSNPISLIVLNTKNQIEIGEYIKSELAKIGLSIEVTPKDNLEIVNNHIKNRDFEMLLYNVEIDSPLTLYAFWHSSQRNAPGYNFTSYASKTFDNNLEIIRETNSEEQLNNALTELQTEFYNEFPYIPLYTQTKSIYHKINSEILLPNKISNYKELSSEISEWYTKQEKIYNFIRKYDSLAEQIYKKLH